MTALNLNQTSTLRSRGYDADKYTQLLHIKPVSCINPEQTDGKVIERGRIPNLLCSHREHGPVLRWITLINIILRRTVLRHYVIQGQSCLSRTLSSYPASDRDWHTIQGWEKTLSV